MKNHSTVILYSMYSNRYITVSRWRSMSVLMNDTIDTSWRNCLQVCGYLISKGNRALEIIQPPSLSSINNRHHYFQLNSGNRQRSLLNPTPSYAHSYVAFPADLIGVIVFPLSIQVGESWGKNRPCNSILVDIHSNVTDICRGWFNPPYGTGSRCFLISEHKWWLHTDSNRRFLPVSRRIVIGNCLIPECIEKL